MNLSAEPSVSQEWPQPAQFKRSIRLEFSLYVLIIVLVLMLTTGYIITDRYVESVTRLVVEKLLIQSRSYSSTAGKHIIGTDSPDELMLNNLCRRFASDNPDVYWVGIAGADSTLIAHTDITQVVSASCLSFGGPRQYGQLLQPGESFSYRNDTITITIPVKESDVLVGTLGVASSARQVSEARRISVTAAASVTALMLLLGIPVTMLVVHRKLRPISQISAGLRHLDFDTLTLHLPIHTRNEFGYLAETLRFMTSRLRVSRKQVIENERLARELEIAHDIQANILPRSYPQGREFEFCGAYRSAREVGGDYYDFIEFDSERLGFLVADVSGKSLPGMLVMLLTRDIIRSLARTIEDPAHLLTQVNRELLPNIKKGMFVTMAFGILEQRTGQMSLGSAGHNPFIRIDGETGCPELIKPPGFPLGLLPPDLFDRRIKNYRLTLSPGDWIIQYTDGVSEAHNERHEEFGMDRFLQAVQSCCGLTPRQLVDRLLHTHQSFVGEAPQYDDITLVAMKWTGPNASMNTCISREYAHVN